MFKPIGPQYIAAKKNQRVGLTHLSKVVERLMGIYGLEDELIELQEQEAAEMQSAEFDIQPIAVVPTVAGCNVTQDTFAWFE